MKTLISHVLKKYGAPTFASIAPPSFAAITIFSGLGPENLETALKNADEFLNAVLFLSLFGVCLAAASLFASTGIQKSQYATSLFATKNSNAPSEQSKSLELEKAANWFLLATYPLMLGVASSFALDLFEPQSGLGLEVGISISSAWEHFVAIVRGEVPNLADELVEIVIGSGALGVAFFWMFRGLSAAFKGLKQ